MYLARRGGNVVLNALKRIFGKSHEGPAAVSPAEAEIRLKALKAQLAKNKAEAKRLSSAVEKNPTLSAEQKASHKQRLRQLEADRKPIVAEMKVLHKRLPKK